MPTILPTANTLVSGPYEWYVQIAAGAGNKVQLGIVEDAPRFRAVNSDIVVTGDNMGDTIQAIISRGTNVFIDLVFQEFNLTWVQQLIWPHGVAAAVPNTRIGTLEVGNSGFAHGLGCVKPNWVLHADKVENSCAKPDHWTALRAQIAPNFDLSFLMGTRTRNVPMSFLLMPWVDSAPASNPEVNYTHVHNDGKIRSIAGWNDP